MTNTEYEKAQMPLISILMAVYNPNLDWLRVQLQSLNAQDYPNLRLYIRDDCSPRVPMADVERAVEECITAFPVVLRRNEVNLGSNLTFQRLTEEAEGDLFAYCDQDDCWLPEKLTVLREDMVRSGALMAYSDVAIMDGEGNHTADSILELRRHCIMLSGSGLAPQLLIHNFVFGCAMLVDAGAARAAVPFCPHYYHDHYLTLWCAEHGSIYAESCSLIRYRIHGSNQTMVMVGVEDKRSYEKMRIQDQLDKLTWLDAHFPCCPETKAAIREGLLWTQARKRNWKNGRGKLTMWKYRSFEPKTTLFELVLGGMPDWLLMTAVRMLRRNQL